VGAAVGTTDTTHTQTRSDTQLVDVWEGGDNAFSTQHLQTTTSTQTTTGTQQFAQGSDISAQGKLTIQSGADMAIDSSALKGEQGVVLLSAGDLNIGGQHIKGQSTESKPATAGQQETTTAKETQTFAGSTISSGSGSVTAAALGDLSASGSTLAAEQNINLIGDSVSVNAQVNTTTSKEVQGNPYGGRHWQITDKQTQTLAGGKVEAGQDINVIAGMSAELGYQVGLLASPTSALPERANNTPNANSGNITLSGAQLSAGTPDSKEVGQEAGQVNLLAQGDIDIGTVELVNKSDTFKFDKYSNTGGNTTITQRTVTETHTQVGTSVSADPINVAAGGNLNMTGSAVSAAGDVNLAATGNVTIQAATNTETKYTEDSKRSSGITSSGGFGIHIGTSSQKSQAWLDATSQSQGMSLVGSTEGDVRIVSGKTYTQQGSDVLTPQGDIAILAKSVNIEDGRDKLHLQTKQEFKQSGLTVALSGGILDTLTATGEAIEGVTGDGSNRNKTLNALIAYGKANDLIVQGKAVGNAAKQNGVLNSEGKTDAAAASGIKVSIGVGSSSSNSQSDEQFTKGTGSTIKAAGNVTVIATEGDLNVKGSRVQAKNDLALMAANNVNIVASSDTQTHRSSNESSSASVGVSFGVGSGSAGVSLDIAASKGKGQANSDSTTSQSSQVAAGHRVTIISGQDTSVRGGNVHGHQVVAHVGGDLNIESLQDTSTSQANQKTTGVALSIPITGAGGGASISQSKQNSNSNYQSVGQQSGISAGEGGFQINVKNNTDLKGAAIASTASADKNSLITGTLTTSDIHNTMSASASSSGTSVGTHMVSGKYELGKAVVGNALNNGSADQSDASTTKTAISGAQVTVNGVTTDTSKEALTDSDGKTVNTDISNTNRALAKVDVAGLQKQAQQQQADNMLTFKAAVTVSDPINRAMTADKKIILQTCQADGQCEQKRVNANDVKLGPDGKVYVFNNGIMNTETQALDNAAKQSSPQANSQGVYVIINPHTGNVVSEIIYAGIDKLNEITGAVLPISNASEANIDVRNTAKTQGGQVVEVNHSRGSLTSSNATAEQINQGERNAPIDSVTFNGAAANAQRMSDRVDTVTGGTGTVQQSTHKDDKIGTVIGGNAPTGGRDASVGDAHTNYGPGVNKDQKEKVWGNGVGSVPVVIPTTNSQGGAK
jgi:filamentous hemagglutinin